MLNKENNPFKRGQIYSDESGENWIYWGGVRVYEDRPNSKYGRVSHNSPTLGKFYRVGKAPKGYYCPDHKTSEAELPYEKVTFVANSAKDLDLLTSGVDIKLIALMNKAIKDIKNLNNVSDEEWSYDAVVYWMHGLKRFTECLSNLDSNPIPHICTGHHQLNNVLEPRLRNANITSMIEEPIKNANEQTVIELKKIAKIIEKERLNVLNNGAVKRRHVEGYIEKYYDDPEKEFLNSLISNSMIYDMDFVNGGFTISEVKVKVDVNESCSGNIQYFSYRNVGTAEVNGVVLSGDFYSNKSHGWNYNN